jgi:hypothetical protein
MEKLIGQEVPDRINKIQEHSRALNTFHAILYDSDVLQEMRANGGKFKHDYKSLPEPILKKAVPPFVQSETVNNLSTFKEDCNLFEMESNLSKEKQRARIERKRTGKHITVK